MIRHRICDRDHLGIALAEESPDSKDSSNEGIPISAVEHLELICGSVGLRCPNEHLAAAADGAYPAVAAALTPPAWGWTFRM